MCDRCALSLLIGVAGCTLCNKTEGVPSIAGAIGDWAKPPCCAADWMIEEDSMRGTCCSTCFTKFASVVWCTRIPESSSVSDSRSNRGRVLVKGRGTIKPVAAA